MLEGKKRLDTIQGCGRPGSTRWHIEQVYPIQLAPAAGTDVQKINTLDLQPRIWSTGIFFLISVADQLRNKRGEREKGKRSSLLASEEFMCLSCSTNKPQDCSLLRILPQ